LRPPALAIGKNRKSEARNLCVAALTPLAVIRPASQDAQNDSLISVMSRETGRARAPSRKGSALLGLTILRV